VLPIAQALAVEVGCEPVVVAEADRAAYADAIEAVTAFSRSIIGQSTAERALREASTPPPLI
jgi:predicted short-subunit dehydrogenase-like oxidoreductase (DUF2520 family)